MTDITVLRRNAIEFFVLFLPLLSEDSGRSIEETIELMKSCIDEAGCVLKSDGKVKWISDKHI